MSQDGIEVKVSADDTSLQSGLNKASSRTKSFESEQKRSADAVSKSWQQASSTVGKALLAFSAAGQAGMAVVGNQAAKFELNMRKANVVAKLSEQGFADLTKQVTALSDRLKSTRSITEMSDALAEIYAAGAEGAQALAILENGVQAADAGMADLQKTTSVLLTAMKAYNIPAEQAAKVSDILFKTVDRGNVSFEELASTIGPALVTGAKFGISMEEVAAAVAELTLTAPSASEAVTGLERTMVQLGAPTAETEKKLRALGVSYGRAALESKGLMGVLREFEAAAGGSDAELRRLLSSSEALKGSFALTANGGKAYSEALEEMKEAAGSTAKANQEMAKSVSFSMGILKAEATNAAVKIGQSLMPIAKEFIDAGIQMVGKFNAMDEASRQSVIGMGFAATAISGVTGAAFLLAPQIAAIPKAFASMRLGAVALAGVIGPGGKLMLAMAALGLAMKGLSAAWESDWLHIRTTTERQVKAVQEALQGLPSVFPGVAGIGGPTVDPQDVRARRLAGELGPRIVGQSNGVNLQQLPAGLRSSGLKVTIADAAKAPKALQDSSAEQARLDKIRRESERLQLEAIDHKKKANKQAKERHKSEDELRLAMVRQAKALVGMPTAAVKDAMGGAGDEFTQCANAIRLVSKRADNVFPVDLNPFDKKLLGPGEGVGPAMADSLFGSKVGKFFRDKSQARAGDLAFWEDPKRPGVVQHVEMVDDQGGTIGASSGSRRVVQRQGIGDLGPNRRLLGFISPSAYQSGAKSELGGTGNAYLEELQARRRAFLEFTMREIDRDVAQIYADAERALLGATSDAEREKVIAQRDKVAMRATSDDFERRNEISMDLPTNEVAYWDQIVEAQRRAYEQRRELGIADTEARIMEIAKVLEQEALAEDTRASLIGERNALWDEQWAVQQERRQTTLDNLLADMEWEMQMGQMSLEQKISLLQQELSHFEGTQQQKRALLLELHNAEMQLMAERNAFADSMFQSFEQGLQGMLTQALSSQQSFSDSFKSLWKSVANQVLAELAKMIVRALVLQKILRGIFGFFGGILGVGGAAASAASSVDLGGGLGVAHTGGMVVPGGIKKFHRGGGVGIGLAPDEVLAKLQVGEMVLSREHVRQASEAPPPGIQMTNHFHGNSGSEADARHFGDILGRQVTRRLTEAT